jgi:hypothetical protein
MSEKVICFAKVKKQAPQLRRVGFPDSPLRCHSATSVEATSNVVPASTSLLVSYLAPVEVEVRGTKGVIVSEIDSCALQPAVDSSGNS